MITQTNKQKNVGSVFFAETRHTCFNRRLIFTVTQMQKPTLGVFWTHGYLFAVVEPKIFQGMQQHRKNYTKSKAEKTQRSTINLSYSLYIKRLAESDPHKISTLIYQIYK